MKTLFGGHRRAALIFASLVSVLTFQVHALNDTGTTRCYDSSSSFPVACSASVIGDPGTHPRQDARFGRDVHPAPGKIGGGSAGFDFTKIANNGTARPASTVRGPNATDWACTRDNVTGLTWEVKTTTGLREASLLYSWYNSNSASNGGNAGTQTGGTCGSTLTNCNTEAYIAAVNAAALCGYTDWRLPSVKEAMSIFNGEAASGTVPIAFDPTYFADGMGLFWTANTQLGAATNALYVQSSFNPGILRFGAKSANVNVRLVRGTYLFQ